MARLSEWNPAVRVSELVDGSPMTVGARYRCVIRNGPARVTATPTLCELDHGRLVSYEGKFGFAHSRDTISFEPSDGRTRFTFTNVSTLPNWTAPFSGLIERIFHRQAQRSINGAVDHLDQLFSIRKGE